MKTLILFFVTAAVLGDVLSLPDPEPACLNALAPPTNARGVNRLDRDSDEPLFRLHFSPHASGNGLEAYRVHLSVTNDVIGYSDAKISLSSYGSCGSGSLTFGHSHFFEEIQSDSCPRLLLTNRKEPMTSLPHLLWTPPSCGCVQFRALAIEGGEVFYADNEDVNNGPLSQTICMDEKLSKEQYLDALCKAHDRYSVAQILSRPSFLKRHRLETRKIDRFELEMGLELRRSDNKMCCSKPSDKSRSVCFDDTRRRRVDRFCEDGYPDIPFTSLRLSHMRDREINCCFILGEHRYSCFAKGSNLQNETDKTILDFSKDETDPVNDLAEFATLKDKAIVQTLGTAQFGVTIAQKQDQDDDESDEDTYHKVTTVVYEQEDTRNKNPTARTETETKHSRKFSLKKTMAPSFTTEQEKLTTRLSNSDHNVKATLRKENSEVRMPKTKLSSGERRKLEKDMKERRKGRRLSGERVFSRRQPSRELLDRRGSTERLERLDRRRSSLDRASAASAASAASRKKTLAVPSRGVAIPTKGKRKSTGLSRQASVERRANGWGSNHGRDDLFDVNGGDFQEGFEDQGGLSVEETLSKLNRRMKRLRMKSQCCEAGALSGIHVYGKFTHTWNECEHSGEKYIARARLESGAIVCLEQFKKCCIEQAVSGPTITSSEFRESKYMYPNNMDRLEPTLDQSDLYRHEDDLKMPAPQAGGLQRKNPGQDMRETPEIFERESERRFNAMRTVDAEVEDDEDEEKNGPQRFDEADNKENANVFDDLNRGTGRNDKTTHADEEIDDFDDRDFGGDSNKDDEDDILDKKIDRNMEKTQIPQRGVDAKKHVSLRQPANRRKNSDAEKLKPMTPRRNSDNYDAGLLALAPKATSRRSRNSRGRSGGRSKSRRRNSRGSRKRSSRRRSSRRSSREQRRLASHQRYPSVHTKYQPHYFGHQGKALDSQEMAAAHNKKFAGTLDSREMAEAFIKRKRKSDAFESDVMEDSSMKRRRRPYYFSSRMYFGK